MTKPIVGPDPPLCPGFAITLRQTTVGRNPLHEWSARHRDLYLTAHNTHNRQAFMILAGPEPANPASDDRRPALDRAATGIRILWLILCNFFLFSSTHFIKTAVWNLSHCVITVDGKGDKAAPFVILQSIGILSVASQWHVLISEFLVTSPVFSEESCILLNLCFVLIFVVCLP